MSVAKSYEKCEILRGPYEKNKRFYVEVAYKCCSKKTCQKCGGSGFYPKEVRWYNDTIIFDAKTAFGFRRGTEEQIFLCCGEPTFLSKYFLEIAPRTARFNLLFDWYMYEPTSLPEGITLLPLKWGEISNNDTILSYDKVREIVLKKKGAKN